MMAIDDLVAAISTLQRSHLEDWIRDELVAPQQDTGALVPVKADRLGLPVIASSHRPLADPP